MGLIETEYLGEHIPKTGLTAVREFFYRTKNPFVVISDNGMLFPSDADPSPVIRYPALDYLKTHLATSATGRKLLKIAFGQTRGQYQDFVPDNPIKIIFGHSVFKQLESDHPEAQLLTVVRDPLPRTVSQYFFVLNDKAITGYLPDWAIGNEDELPLSQFLTDPETANFQTKYLNGYISKLKFIGVTDKLENFVRYLFPDKKIVLGRRNITKRPKLHIPDQVIYEFKKLNKQDYELYEYAKNTFNA